MLSVSSTSTPKSFSAGLLSLPSLPILYWYQGVALSQVQDPYKVHSSSKQSRKVGEKDIINTLYGILFSVSILQFYLTFFKKTKPKGEQ